MSGSTRSRLLWAALLTPPILILACAAAVSLWPLQVVGAFDKVAGLLTPSPSSHDRPAGGRSRMPPPSAPAPTIQTRLTVLHPDGSPYNGRVHVHARSIHRHGNSGGGTSHDQQGPEILVNGHSGRTWIVVKADGYAPSILKPAVDETTPPKKTDSQPVEAENTDEQPAEPIQVVLEKGFPHRVRVVDAESAPIVGAEVHAALTIQDMPVRLSGAWTTDDDGWITIPDVAEADYEVDVNVYDYSIPDETVFFQAKPGADTTIELERGPLNGVVVDEQGGPVAGATILLAAERDMGANTILKAHLLNRVVLATSDADGRFVLPHLHRDSVHLIEGEGADGSLGYAAGVRLDGPEPKLTLHPRRMVRGLLKPAPTSHAGWALGPVMKRSLTIDEAPASADRETTPNAARQNVVTFTRHLRCDAEGRFEFPLWPTIDCELTAPGGPPVQVSWPLPEEPIVVEAAPAPEPVEQKVQLRISADAATRPLSGQMTLLLRNGPPERALQRVPRLVDVHDGQGEFLALASDSFHYETDAIPGYWTAPGDIQPSWGPRERLVDVRVFAIGSLVGRVVDADGDPVTEGATLAAQIDAPAPAPGFPSTNQPMWAGFTHRPMSAGQASAPSAPPIALKLDGQGRFEVPSWPLGVGCRITVDHGLWREVSDRIELNAEGPRREVSIQLPRRRNVDLRIVDPEGRPLAGVEVSVVLIRPTGLTGGWTRGPTDADGRLTLTGLAGGANPYRVMVNFPEDFLPISEMLDPDATSRELRTVRGRVLEGNVIEAVTGQPIPKFQVLARRVPDLTFAASVETDDEGRFRFSNLPEGIVRLSDTRGQKWLGPQPLDVSTGAVEPILIRVLNRSREAPRLFERLSVTH